MHLDAAGFEVILVFGALKRHVSIALSPSTRLVIATCARGLQRQNIRLLRRSKTRSLCMSN